MQVYQGSLMGYTWKEVRTVRTEDEAMVAAEDSAELAEALNLA